MDEKSILKKRWKLASNEQRTRIHNLLSSYPGIQWVYKENKYLLWLCKLDIDTFEIFEMILGKIKQDSSKKANHSK